MIADIEDRQISSINSEGKAPPVCGLRSADDIRHINPFSREGGPACETKSFSFGAGSSSILRALGAVPGGRDHVTRPYLESPWVYACVNAITRAVGCVPMVIRRSADPESDIVTDGKLYDLFRRPNPLYTQRGTLRLQTIYHFLHGEVFWFLSQRRRTRDGLSMFEMEDRGLGRIDVPDEIWLVAGNIVEMVQDEQSKLPIAWEYNAGREKVRFSAHSVVHVHEIDPYSPFRGVGPMTAAMRSVSQDFATERFTEALLANGGQPNGTFSVKSGSLSPAERQMVKESFAANQGDPDKHRTPLVLPSDMEFKPHSWSPQDMEFRELKVWLRDTIMAIFGVTKPVLGLTDDVNRSNAQEAMRAFWENTIQPYLDFLTDQINSGFVSRLSGPESEYRIFFDTASVDALRDSADSKIDRISRLMNIGRSFNESASMVDMEIEEDVDGGDERYVPGGWQRVNGSNKAMEDDADGELSAENVQDDEGGSSKKSVGETRKTRDRSERAKIANSADEELAPVVASMTKKVQSSVRAFALATRANIRDYAKGTAKSVAIQEKATSKEIETVLRRIIKRTAGEWSDSFLRAIDPGYRGAFKVGAQSVANVTGGRALTVDIPEIASSLVSRKRDALVQVSATLQDEIYLAVRAAVDEAGTSASESVRALLARTDSSWAPAVNKLIREAAFRAERIARTETTSIANWTRVQQMEEDGINEHEWVTSDDEFVRSKHVKLDGKIVEVGKEFSPGLKFPGDTDAPVDQVINCRCTVIPVVPDSEDEDQ